MRSIVVALSLTVTTYAAVPQQQITWVQPNIDPTQAQFLIYTLTITEEGNPTPRVVGLLNVLCGGSTTRAECSTVLPLEAQSAIITGNTSQLTAKDPQTNVSSLASPPFTGNQGCIFRDNLYKVGQRASESTNKQGLTRLLAEFQKAKFKHMTTSDLKGNQYAVLEECAGYLVS
jgi:hypothetical protein